MKSDNYLEKLHEISQEVDLFDDPYKCFDKVLEKISTIGLRNCRIKFIDNDGYITGNDGRSISSRLRGGILDRVARNGTPMIVAMDEGGGAMSGDTAYLICVPVRCGRDVVAVLAAERENPAEDTLENDLQLLGVMSSFLAWPAQRIKPGIGKREQSLSGGSAKLSLTRQVENFERELIIKALKITRGNQTKAADLLGVSLRIINYRIGKLNLDYRHFRKES